MTGKLDEGPCHINHWRYKREGVVQAERAMLNEILDLPDTIEDPYAISLHLQMKYETVSKYYTEHNGGAIPYGLILAHTNPEDIKQRRLDAIIDLGISKELCTSIPDLFNLPSSEFRHILKRFRKRADDKRNAMAKIKAERDKGKRQQDNFDDR